MHAFHSDGTLIYATSMDAEFNTTFVAIDAAGAIVKEVPSTLYSVYDALLINGTIFLVGSGPNACGFFPFDTATLTPGAPIAVNDGSSCNSSVSFDPGSTTVAWVINDSAKELVRADLATGEVVRTPFGAAIPEHYESFGLAVLGGAAYVPLYPSFDPVTGEQYIAADGTELPELVLRFDPATATGTTVAGQGVDVVDGVVVVYTQEQTMQLDPATMSLSPYDGEFGGLPEGVAGDGVAWYTYTDSETSELVVSSRTPETAAIVNEARIVVPFLPTATWRQASPCLTVFRTSLRRHRRTTRRPNRPPSTPSSTGRQAGEPTDVQASSVTSASAAADTGPTSTTAGVTSAGLDSAALASVDGPCSSP